MNGLVSREVAVGEINKWLEFKKVSDNKRETYKDYIETLVDAVESGNLMLKEDYSLLQKMKHSDAIGDLEFKPRLKVSTVQNHLQNVKSGDADGRLTAYIAALTSKNKGLIKDMDTDDFGISQSIAVFFL
jgi:DNA primase